MKLLMDTHVLLWLLREPQRLSATVAAAIKDPGNAVLVSAASAWEIAIKVRAGKLDFDEDFLSDFAAKVAAMGFDPIVITAAHAIGAGRLSSPHKDPFDRMLAAQALAEQAVMATADPAFAFLGPQVIW